jgi:23S rRNA (guanine2445-N2)-methyltransferase / 23S rRNA (guanine2069-N7)-methyltransferase
VRIYMAIVFTATISRGLEEPLAQELRQLGLQRVVPEQGAVRFMGKLRDGYKACLWSRLSSRILLRLSRFEAVTPEDLYAGIQAIDWSEHLRSKGSLWIDFNGRSRDIRHSQFGARKTKDAIVDQLRTASGARPEVVKEKPDLRVNVHLRNGVVTASIDLSGDALHWRTPNRRLTEAPLRETVAAAVLQLAGWPKAAREGKAFIDPMCGSGAILVEAAGMAANIAPGLVRKKWGFSRWLGHSPSVWQVLRQEAEARRERGKLRILGFDMDREAISASRYNLAQIGIEGVELRCAPLHRLRSSDGPGLVVVNPPYGERIGEDEDLMGLYKSIGDQLRNHMLGWEAYVLGPKELVKHIGLKPHSKHLVKNGPLDCRLNGYSISGKAPAGHPKR